MRMRWSLAGLAVLLPAATLAPKPKAVVRLNFAAVGDTVTARWAFRSALLSIDTVIVAWSRKAPGATSYTALTPNDRTRGTSATRLIPLPAMGETDTVQACAWVKRVGTANSPTTCGKLARTVPLTPPDPVDSLEVVGIILKPDSVKLLPDSTCQFCAGLRLSDETIVLAGNSPIDSCAKYWPGTSGTLGLHQANVFLTNWIIDRDGPFVTFAYDPVTGYAHPQVENATLMGGTWWFNGKWKELAS